MDFSLPYDLKDDHSRTIIHIDLDCFYAQVEMLKNPDLRNVPLGIKQKNIVVTSNYPARMFGVEKCMLIDEAKRICPNLVLVNGEDLHDYRQTSYSVTNFLQKYTCRVERLGLDENYLDISELVTERLKNGSLSTASDEDSVDMHIFGTGRNECDCGCNQRLQTGAKIAIEIRRGLKEQLSLTSCAGISHNKILAKLVGSKNKPSKQTLLYPSDVSALIHSLSSVKSIPGIGYSTVNSLSEKLNVTSIRDLQSCSLETLQNLFGKDKGRWLLEISFGIDSSPVKASGKPQSIGLEDSCKSIKAQPEVKNKLNQLLSRLVILVKEDGRTPRTIKLTVRKFNKETKIGQRETRQCNLPAGLFTSRLELPPTAEEKLMAMIMRLFTKIVDISKPYHVTLLGLGFTKFYEKATGKNSVASFFKSNDVAVQSILNIQNSSGDDSIASMMDYSSSLRQQDFSTDGSESEVEPSPKKSKKLAPLIARRRCFRNLMDCGSPSKLKVSELRLNSRDSDIACPPNVDESVFRELPMDVQQELSQQWKREQPQTSCTAQAKKQKTNTLYNYFIKNCDQI